MAQPPRFAARTATIQNEKMIPMARLLYLHLDDIAHQCGVVEVARWVIADALGISQRHVTRLLSVLREAKLILTQHGADRERHTLAWVPDGTGRTGPVRRGRTGPEDWTYRSSLDSRIKSKGIQDTSSAPPECKCNGKGIVPRTIHGVLYELPCPAGCLRRSA